MHHLSYHFNSFSNNKIKEATMIFKKKKKKNDHYEKEKFVFKKKSQIALNSF